MITKLFLLIFRPFLLISGIKSLKKFQNEQKRLKTADKKVVRPAFGCRQHPKLVEIHNIYGFNSPGQCPLSPRGRRDRRAQLNRNESGKIFP